MDNPIRGRTRPLPVKAEAVKRLDANLNAKIHNRFDVEVIDAVTGKIKQRAQAENVICNQLWARLLTPAAYFNYIHYGTGTGTPAVTDTSLFTFLGYGTPAGADNVQSIDAANKVYSLRRKIQLSETTAVGSTITEVGIGYSTTAATLCTHAMLKDMNGNQINIAKTATDIINIYATVFVHFDDYDSGHIVFNYLPTSGAVGSAFGNSFFSYIAGLGGSTPGANYCHALHGRNGTVSNNTPMVSTYSVSNKTITMTATRIGVDSINIGGFTTIALTSNDNNALAILSTGGTWYSGTDIVGEAIGTGDGTTTKFKTEFGLASNATIYVDGVAAQNVAISKLPLISSTARLSNWFDDIYIDNGIAYPTLHLPFGTGYGAGYANNDRFYTYNKYYEYGIKSFHIYNCHVYASDDLNNWSLIGEDGTTNGAGITLTANQRNYKYWCIAPWSVGGSPCISDVLIYTPITSDIEFATPPATGAAITADYHTDAVGKNSNYVFDLAVTVTLGEYSA